jgi:hypothetical protein
MRAIGMLKPGCCKQISYFHELTLCYITVVVLLGLLLAGCATSADYNAPDASYNPVTSPATMGGQSAMAQ